MSHKRDLIAAKLLRWEKYLQGYTFPKWDELPAFEVYMDQLISLLSGYLDIMPRDERDGKILTPSAINNYVRLKLMPPPNGKRYGRTHMAYLIIIGSLKCSVSMRNIQRMLPLGLSEAHVQRVYDAYVDSHRAASLFFIEQARTTAGALLQNKPMDEAEADAAVSEFIISCAVLTGLSGILTEKLLRLNIFEIEQSPAQECMPV